MANTAKLHRISPLGTAQGQRSRKIFDSAKLSVREVAFLKLTSVRTLPKADGQALIGELLKAASLSAPAKSCTLSGEGNEYCGWFEPRAWMIVSEKVLSLPVVGGALVTDLSDRLAVFDVSGPMARDLIAAGCDPSLFEVGGFTRVRFGNLANVIVAHPKEQSYRLMLDVSIAAPFAQWLHQTAEDLG